MRISNLSKRASAPQATPTGRAQNRQIPSSIRRGLPLFVVLGIIFLAASTFMIGAWANGSVAKSPTQIPDDVLLGRVSPSTPIRPVSSSKPNAVTSPNAVTLWYNGDLDTGALPNGVNFASNADAHVFTDFTVTDPAGWAVSAVFSNNLMDQPITEASFEIRSGVSAGNPGVFVHGGYGGATQTLTGRTIAGRNEYRIEIPNLSIALAPGTYYLSVTPTGAGVGYSYVSNTAGLNAIGTPAGNNDNEFWRTPTENYSDTSAQGGDFSQGVVGNVVIPCGVYSTTYVDDNWSNTPIGDDPDGAGPATYYGCDSFRNVQGGVSAVATGGTVLVAAGNYQFDAQILINRSMTVTGAGAATTLINGGNQAITAAGLVRIVTPLGDTGTTTFSGFTVTNPGLSPETGGTHVAIYARPLDALATTVVSNNAILGVNASDNGFYVIRNLGSVVFNDNVITNIGFNPIVIERSEGPTNVHHNNISGNAFTAYFNFTYADTNVTSLQRVADNVISGATASGIAFSGGYPAAPPFTGTFSDVQILNNSITELAAAKTGITIQNLSAAGSGTTGVISNARIRQNIITGSGGLNSKGIRLDGYVEGTRIEQNDIRNLDRGISGEIRNGHSASGTQAFLNLIVGNTTGVFWDAADPISGAENWWGCNYGPGATGAGCSGVTNGIAGANAAGVLFDPWLVLGITAMPGEITPGGTSDITADMLHVSNGGELKSPPPPVGVAFASSEGTITPANSTTTNGQAGALFTSTSVNNGSASATVDGQIVSTIITVTAPAFSIDDVSMSEGDAGTTSFVFTITRSGATTLDSEITFATQDETATIADGDYQANNGTVTFLAGDKAKQITVLVNGDISVEGNETFLVNLTAATNGTVGDGQGVGTIINDDAAPLFLSIGDAKIFEGDTGSRNLVFTVTLSSSAARAAGDPVATMHYHTTNGTAKSADNDYVPVTDGILSFTQGGSTTATISIQVNGDTKFESNEFLFVTLDQAQGATITDAQGTGIIVDEDRVYVGDLDRDRKADLTVFRSSDANWYTIKSSDGNPIYLKFGVSSDEPVPGDYDGDGVMDYAVRRNGGTNLWYYQFSSDLSLNSAVFGIDSDVSVQADYDGDAKTDVAVFRDGSWYILQSSDGLMKTVSFGLAGDIPVTGDFDGDARADFTVFRDGVWYTQRSSDDAVVSQPWGQAGDKPIAGDFDGDGRFDYTVFRNGDWYILESLSGNLRSVNWGLTGDLAVVADYDGDGTSDIAVFRPSEGNWYALRSLDNSLYSFHWGQSGDVPVPAAYLP